MLKENRKTPPLSLRKPDTSRISPKNPTQLDIQATVIAKKYLKYIHLHFKEKHQQKPSQKMNKVFQRFVEFIERLFKERFESLLASQLTTILNNLVFSYEPEIRGLDSSVLQKSELKVFAYTKLEKEIEKFEQEKINLNAQIKQVNERMAKLSDKFDQKIRVQEIQYLNIIKAVKKKKENAEKENIPEKRRLRISKEKTGPINKDLSNT